ncbi:flagellar assembly protein A [Spirochaeta isovalerica]|uniref:Uncharacterized protein (DUF342 family) n=1 Tax=Spirochaeta isovalerica TaxID=150 RepID=A0A841R6S2_9SPIO|nr:flagellar assembly protein A [Spirochaeta isovalerica]MBB6479533.1 uncharacterized protein (DUF342 family) [Spirochaeta isovalerica]
MKPVGNEEQKDDSVKEIIESVMEQDCPELPVLEDSSSGEPDTNGSVEIHISPDKMSVLVSFFPHLGNGKRLNTGDVVSLLSERGVDRSLVNREAIDNALWTCEEDSSSVKDVEVARGIPPRRGR